MTLSIKEKILIMNSSVKQKEERNYFADPLISEIFSENTYTCHFLQRQDYISALVKYLPFLINTYSYL